MIKYNLLNQFVDFHLETGMRLSDYPQKNTILAAFGDANTVYRFAGLTKLLPENTCDSEKIEAYRAQYMKGPYQARKFIDSLLDAKEKYDRQNYVRPYLKPFSTHKVWEKTFESEETFLEALIVFCYEKDDPKAILTRYIMFVNEHNRVPNPEEIEGSELLIARYHDWDGLAKRFEADTFYKEKLAEKNKTCRKAYYAFTIRQAAETLGRSPRFFEVESAYTVMRLFGSWSNALIYAGFEPWDAKATRRNRTRCIRNEQIRDEYIAITERTGCLPSSANFKYTTTVINRFGSWRNFISAVMEYEPALKNYTNTKERRRVGIAEIRRVVQKYNLLEVFKDGDARIAMAKEAKNAEKLAAEHKTVVKDSEDKFDTMNQLLQEFTTESISKGSILTEEQFASCDEACELFETWDGFVTSALIITPSLNSLPNPNEAE